MANTTTKYKGMNRLKFPDITSQLKHYADILTGSGDLQHVHIPENWYVVTRGTFKIGDHFLSETDPRFRTHNFVRVAMEDVGFPVSKYKLVIRNSVVRDTTYRGLLHTAKLTQKIPSASPFDASRWTW